MIIMTETNPNSIEKAADCGCDKTKKSLDKAVSDVETGSYLSKLGTSIEDGWDSLKDWVAGDEKDVDKKSAENLSANDRIDGWASKYKNVTQNGLKEDGSKFYWTTETTVDSLEGCPLLQIRGNCVHFINGHVEGQRVFTLDRIEELLSGDCNKTCETCEKAETTPKTDADMMGRLSFKFNMERTSETTCIPPQIFPFMCEEIVVADGCCCGHYQMGCLEGDFRMEEDEFCEYLLDCGCDGEQELPKPLIGLDDFCDVDCSDYPDLVGAKYDVFFQEYLEILTTVNQDMTTLTDSVLLSLEQNIIELQTDANGFSKFTEADKIAFGALFKSVGADKAPTGSSIQIVLIQALKIVRFEKQRRAKQGPSV